MAKVIRFSVGRGGQNSLPLDVMTIQYLLNCVPASKGGPSSELVVDGIAGPKTMAAITDFQRNQLTGPDGRVDPGGPTLSLLQQFDPFPDQPMPPTAASAKSQFSHKKWSEPAGAKDYKDTLYKHFKHLTGLDFKDAKWAAYKDPGYKDSTGFGNKFPGGAGYKKAPGSGYKDSGPGGFKDFGGPGYKKTPGSGFKGPGY